jgi:hypothetical protein
VVVRTQCIDGVSLKVVGEDHEWFQFGKER